MGQARGSAIVATTLLLSCCEISDATNYTIGGDDGWNFKVHDWPTGKKFHTHDTLVFKYNMDSTMWWW
ncbi:PREDICTED: basic blue [Prunus dulcis]|uniref:PREDICTED: basic blue n=1 Tax=Prunus dulcis TaxID=3755 RepID=A0A5E4F638_PRUDU|nr:PREDICTED: basic blue [Prunus dulcis]